MSGYAGAAMTTPSFRACIEKSDQIIGQPLGENNVALFLFLGGVSWAFCRPKCEDAPRESCISSRNFRTLDARDHF